MTISLGDTLHSSDKSEILFLVFLVIYLLQVVAAVEEVSAVIAKVRANIIIVRIKSEMDFPARNERTS